MPKAELKQDEHSWDRSYRLELRRVGDLCNYASHVSLIKFNSA